MDGLDTFSIRHELEHRELHEVMRHINYREVGLCDEIDGEHYEELHGFYHEEGGVTIMGARAEQGWGCIFVQDTGAEHDGILECVGFSDDRMYTTQEFVGHVLCEWSDDIAKEELSYHQVMVQGVQGQGVFYREYFYQ
tara:strand:- start:311 stop:724 length:414 start_codon:yes stop_codon:yes gene_type:complete